jgi:hypothetical protein
MLTYIGRRAWQILTAAAGRSLGLATHPSIGPICELCNGALSISEYASIVPSADANS